MTQKDTPLSSPIDSITSYCVRQLMQGETRENIATNLAKMGIETNEAHKVVKSTAQKIMMFTPEEIKVRDVKDCKGTIVWGVGCVVLGLIITFGTFEAAKGGGIYVVTYGLIVGGVLMFCRGLIKMVRILN